MEHFLARFAVLIRAQVAQRYAYAGVQVGELAHAPCHDVPLVVCGGEDGGVGPELLACASQGGLADNLYRIEWLSLLIFLLIYLAVAEHLRLHM